MLQAQGAVSHGFRVLVVVPEGEGIKAMLEAWLDTFALPGKRIEILEAELRQLPSEPGESGAPATWRTASTGAASCAPTPPATACLRAAISIIR